MHKKLLYAQQLSKANKIIEKCTKNLLWNDQNNTDIFHQEITYFSTTLLSISWLNPNLIIELS